MQKYLAFAALLAFMFAISTQSCNGELPSKEQVGEKSADEEAPATPTKQSADATVQLREFLLPETVGDANETTLFIRSKGGRTSFDCERETSRKFRCRAVQ